MVNMNNKCPCPNSYYIIGSSFLGPTGPTGPKGDEGDTPSLAIGEVVTGVPGSQAMVFIRQVNSRNEITTKSI